MHTISDHGANPFRYRAFGLSFCSDLPLPELERAEGTDEAEADVRIRQRDLTGDWEKLPDRSHLQIRGGDVYYFIPGAAIYRIRDGSEIAVSPFGGADPGFVRLYLLGSCMGALLLQRRILPLHGSALAIDGKAYAIVGPSGAGKSTLAAALAARGHRLISDDISPVLFRKGDGLPYAVPSYPQQKLWREAVRQLGMDASGMRSLYGESDKFAVPSGAFFNGNPLPLAGVFELVRGAGSGEAAAEEVRGLHRMPVLTEHTYRNYLISALNLQQWHFSSVARLSAAVRVHRLYRPEGRFSAEELASLITRIVREGA